MDEKEKRSLINENVKQTELQRLKNRAEDKTRKR